MKIRAKMIIMVLPLIVTPLVVSAIIATFSARNSITTVATRFLQFKAEGIIDYAEGQISLIEQSGLEENPVYIDAAKSAIESFAINSIRGETELIFALTEDGEVDISTKPLSLADRDRQALLSLTRNGAEGWKTIELSGILRIIHLAKIPALNLYLFVTEEWDTFYSATNRIVYQMGVILIISLALSVTLLVAFALYFTRPISGMVTTMNSIIETRDLSGRVRILYNDETGRLGHTFNIMVSELSEAYDHIKEYALRAAVAKTKEQKVRNIFQKFVPKDVINQFFADPESMLVGENRLLSVLFSDVRGFTSISEQMPPDEMVESLNQYFSLMVDVIISRNGIVDKYMGDAIMAFFGAPVRRPEDAYNSAIAGIEMCETLTDFNRWQIQRGRPEFNIGVGINYGAVTVGNIGSDKKMDYTVIGDMVNLASRLEGLTKVYKEPVIVSETIYRKINEELPCRLLDKVAVKGRSIASGIYSIRRHLSSHEEEAWANHELGMEAYYDRNFMEATEYFSRVKAILPEDTPSEILLNRCRQYIETAPPDSWKGVVTMTEK
jgi:adenylate cyclase